MLNPERKLGCMENDISLPMAFPHGIMVQLLVDVSKVHPAHDALLTEHVAWHM